MDESPFLEQPEEVQYIHTKTSAQVLPQDSAENGALSTQMQTKEQAGPFPVSLP